MDSEAWVSSCVLFVSRALGRGCSGTCREMKWMLNAHRVRRNGLAVEVGSYLVFEWWDWRLPGQAGP